MSNRKLRKNINENEFDEDDDDDSTIKDEQVRRDITILSARLYDLRERFMKIIDKINHDSNEPLNQIPDTEDTPVKNRSKRRVIEENDNDSTATPDTANDEDEEEDDDDDEQEEEEKENDGNDENNDIETQKTKIRSQIRKLSIESILKRQSTRYEYLKYILQYPKIMKYLTSEDSNCTSVPLRFLEPFIKDHVHKNPNGRIYDKINEQIREIRTIYLKNCI